MISRVSRISTTGRTMQPDILWAKLLLDAATQIENNAETVYSVPEAAD